MEWRLRCLLFLGIDNICSELTVAVRSASIDLVILIVVVVVAVVAAAVPVTEGGGVLLVFRSRPPLPTVLLLSTVG